MTYGREVLQRIVSTAELDEAACAAALGINKRIFGEMLAGQRPIPESMHPLIAAVLGINEALLKTASRELRNSDVVPAIWYKLRGAGLGEIDREYILSIRQLAFYQHQLESITDTQPVRWRGLFEDLRRNRDPQASPKEQGKQAARLFRRSTGLDSGALGIGEVFRPHLRNIGVLVIETAAPQSVFEGCSFYVGPSGALRPCIFANSYKSTWFRRNQVLMHELAHAIFDVESEVAALDIQNDDASTRDLVQESRADAFAQEVLVPAEVLRHVGQRLRLDWQSQEPLDFGPIVAETHVEQRLLATASLEAGLITEEQAQAISECNMGERLRQLSPHALTTREFLKSAGFSEVASTKHRTTTETPQKLLLPPRYVGNVLDAYSGGLISKGKAARMLMIDEYEFEERFPQKELAAAA